MKVKQDENKLAYGLRPIFSYLQIVVLILNRTLLIHLLEASPDCLELFSPTNFYSNSI
jgi:hypothetical protein